MTDAKEPLVIEYLRQEARDGSEFLYDVYGGVVCATSMVLDGFATLTRERDEARKEQESVSSQLWDCMGERDGLRNRLATCETALAVVLPYVRVIREPRRVDYIGEIHGDRDRVYLNGMALRYQQYSAAVLDLLRTAALTQEDA
jgi:hypothetical protein